MIWFTSDTHFCHSNIIKYSNRPFQNVVDMNVALIVNWNERVGTDDLIYHLGDFGFGKLNILQDIFDGLNGKKRLILGNHDKVARQLKGWEYINHYDEINIEDQHIVLFHYAQRVWNRSHYGSIALFGHSHGLMPGNSQSLDVGVDCWNYCPINFVEIQQRLATLPKYVGYRQQCKAASKELAYR